MTSKARNKSTKRTKLSAEHCAQLLKALGDRDRLRIIECLREGPHAVSNLAERLGVGIANVSHHLGVLRRANLVLGARKGKQIIYELPADVLQAAPDDCQRLNLGCCRLEIPSEDRCGE